MSTPYHVHCSVRPHDELILLAAQLIASDRLLYSYDLIVMYSPTIWGSSDIRTHAMLEYSSIQDKSEGEN